MNTKDKIDYSAIIKRYSWLIEKNLDCIISPDADGMLCGLFMSHYLNWRIVGYYDNGKNLLLKNGLRAANCVFLDTEIYRPDIRSVGHHISLFRQNNTKINLDNYKNCLNPNLLRMRTREENFSLKYPMGTIHLLLSIVSKKYSIEFLENSFFVILQADGTINRFLDRHSENLRDWLVYLGIDEKDNILRKIIQKDINLIDINKDYVEYVQKFVKKKKDKIPFSERGDFNPVALNESKTAFSESCAATTVEYLEFLSENTGWDYKKEQWSFADLVLYEFTKKSIKPGLRTFNNAVDENFLSMAITTSVNMDYTLEHPDQLP